MNSEQLLKEYNCWRRGYSGYEMPNPTAIGIAIDSVIAQIAALKEENERLTARVAELEKIVEMCRQAYYAPPRDVPPSTPDDAKRVCSDLRAALSFYRVPASKRGDQ